MKKKRLDFKNMEESTVIIDHVMTRYRSGLYTFILTTGLPGTGKSSKQQRLGELILARLKRRELKVDDIVDSLLEFVRRLRKVRRPGEVIVIEEMSVLFPSRRAMSRDNVDIARILDTVRKKQVILLANAPLYNAIDSHVRAMANVLTETLKINKTKKVVIYKGWRLQTNPGSGKTYRHTFQRGGRDVKRMFTRQPNKEVWIMYEYKKDKFMDKIYERIETESQERETKLEKKKDTHITKNLPLTEKERLAYIMRYEEKMTMKDIAVKMGVSAGTISQRLSKVRQKNKKAKEIEANELINDNKPAFDINYDVHDEKNPAKKAQTSYQ